VALIDSHSQRRRKWNVPTQWISKWWSPLAIFVVLGVFVWIAVWYGNTHLTHDSFFPVRSAVGEAWFGGWARWDSEWYRTIVREGYVYYPGVQSSVAFWPTYPIVLQLLSWAFPSIFITGTVVTVLSGGVAVVALRKWARVFVSDPVAMTAVVVLCVYPFSLYLYGAVYSDALFVATAIVAFLLIERDRVFLAGLVGILATAGRPAGLVVAVALLLRVLELRNVSLGRTGVIARFDPRSMTRHDAPILLSWLGVAAWSAYLWSRFSDPFLFASAQSLWGQGAGPPTWLKFRLFEELASQPLEWSTIGHVVHGLVVIAAIALLPLVKRRFGWAYTWFCVGMIALPVLGTKDFFGAGRYVLGAFPCVVVAAELLVARPRLRAVLLPTSFLVMLLLALAFGRGSYVS